MSFGSFNGPPSGNASPYTGFGSLGPSAPSSQPFFLRAATAPTTAPASVAPTPAAAPAVPDPAPASSLQSNGPVRHPDCYFDGDHVVLALGPQPSLFRIQRTILTKYSETFRDMFQGPFESAIPGSSDDNPVRLPDNPDHFAGVLSVYYGNVLIPRPAKSTFEHTTGVLRVASKYGFDLAVDWALSTLRSTWGTKSNTWLDALVTPSKDHVTQAITLINISHELPNKESSNKEFLGCAFYLLCADEKHSDDQAVYGKMKSEDVFVLLKGTRSLYRLWAEQASSRPAPNPSAPPSNIFGGAPAAASTSAFGQPRTPNVFGGLAFGASATPLVPANPPAPAATPSTPWSNFVRDKATMTTVFRAIGMSLS